MAAEYIHDAGVDNAVAMIRSGATYYYHKDALGSVSAITNSTGAVVRTYTYKTFGTISEETGTLENPYTYTGREYDSETGLFYYRARHYDSALGRFIQKDPIGLAGGMNVYAYVGNNPGNFVDPWGEDLILVGQGGDSGALFTLAAQAWMNANGGTSANVLVNVNNGQEAIQAMQNYFNNNGQISGLQVFSHSGSRALFFNPNQTPQLESLYVDPPEGGTYFNTGEGFATISDITANWFNANATIKLWGCNAALGSNSFAQQLATHIGQNVTVTGATGPTRFSAESNTYVSLPDPVPANYQPVYLVPQYSNRGWITLSP